MSSLVKVTIHGSGGRDGKTFNSYRYFEAAGRWDGKE